MFINGVNTTLSTNEIKNIDKQTVKSNQRRRDNMLGNRLMAALLLVSVLVLGLLLLDYKFRRSMAGFILYVLPVVDIILALCVSTSLIYLVIQKRSRTDESLKFFSSTSLFVASVIGLFVSLAFPKIGTAGALIVLIGSLLLFFVYVVYPADFFAFTILLFAGAGLMFACTMEMSGTIFKDIVKYILKALAFLIPIAAIALGIVLRKNKGCLPFRTKRIRIMKKGYHYYPIFSAAAFILAGAFAVTLLPAALMYVLVAFLAIFLVVAIIYTIKMM